MFVCLQVANWARAVRNAGPSAEEEVGRASSDESSAGVNQDLKTGAVAPPPVMEAWASKRVELEVDKEEPANVTKPGGRRAGAMDAGGAEGGFGRLPKADEIEGLEEERLLGVEASPGARHMPNRSVGGSGDAGGVEIRGCVFSWKGVGRREGETTMLMGMKFAISWGMVVGSASRKVLNKCSSSQELMLGRRRWGQKAKENISLTGSKGKGDREEGRKSSRQAVKYFVKRPPMDLVAEANAASAKRCFVSVQEIDCWIICNLMACSHTSSTCSNMKSLFRNRLFDT